MFYEGYHTYYTYILTNKYTTVLYIGVTNNLGIRLIQHKDEVLKKKKSFTVATIAFTSFIMKNIPGFRKLLHGRKN